MPSGYQLGKRRTRKITVHCWPLVMSNLLRQAKGGKKWQYKVNLISLSSHSHCHL